MILTEKAYKIMRYICLIALPAIGTFLSAVLSLVGVDAQIIAIVVGITTAIDTLLGSLLQIGTNKFNKEFAEEDERGE